MMKVEDDTPWTAETQLGDEEQFIVQPYEDEPIAHAEWVDNYFEERTRR